jgi:hypothetical protein
MDHMLKLVFEQKNRNNQDLKTTFENIQIIYSSAMQEFIRQLSIECEEKGRFLQKVFIEITFMNPKIKTKLFKSGME